MWHSMASLYELYMTLYHTLEIKIASRWQHQGTKLKFLVKGTPQTKFMIEEMARVELRRFERFNLSQGRLNVIGGLKRNLN